MTRTLLIIALVLVGLYLFHMSQAKNSYSTYYKPQEGLLIP